MSEITVTVASLTTLFGVFVTLALLVVGFFKGRAWLRRAMSAADFNEWRADRQSGVAGFVPGGERYSAGYRDRKEAAIRDQWKDEPM